MPSEPAVTEQAEQELKQKPGVSRREFLRRGIWVGTGVVALGGYSSLFEPNHLVTKTLEVPIGNLPESLAGTRIAQISDIHFGDFLGQSHVENVVRTTNELHPDLIVITGDFVTSGGNRRTRHGAIAAEPCARVLSGLYAPLGIFAVLGNHDALSDPVYVTKALEAQRIRVLRNASVPMERDGGRLWVAGVDDVLGRGARVDVTFRGIPGDEPVIALVHEPDFADVLCKQHVDLQLSGHSHGGQVRIPFVGAPVLPEMARKYPLGMYRVRGMQLYTNPGVGVIELPIRFDCPPEITVFTLRRAA
jgi:predicted MPP superfamily phosphohydrolase